MIPIGRDTGSIIAFGGRALEKDQQPKYLNSPETPIYSKSRTLYGLHLSKTAIRQRGFVILVEGYFEEVIQRLHDPVLEEMVRTRIAQKIAEAEEDVREYVAHR